MRALVFDVESVGLHGEGFAVGWVVLQDLERVSEGWAWCDPRLARGTAEGREWITENVSLGAHGLPSGKEFIWPEDLRGEFWSLWLAEREKRATLWADCAWPVEARFLLDCVEDSRPEGYPETNPPTIESSPRCWEGPYPLLDLSALLLAAGINPLDRLTTRGRAPDELPMHHPLCDARQSARYLVECWERLDIK